MTPQKQLYKNRLKAFSTEWQLLIPNERRQSFPFMKTPSKYTLLAPSADVSNGFQVGDKTFLNQS